MGYIHGVANYGGITNFLIYSFIFSLFPLWEAQCHCNSLIFNVRSSIFR